MGELQENVCLADWTNIAVGGPARYFRQVESHDELRQSLNWADEQNLPCFVLGGGSNVVFSDAGFQGLVIRTAMRGLDVRGYGQWRELIAAAGEPWDDLVSRSVTAELAGIECLAGIPGSAGASPIQNIGAYGQEIADTFLWAEAMDRASGKVQRIPAEQCGFAYRNSRFKTAEKDRWVVVRVAFRLEYGGAPALKYAELNRAVEQQHGSNPSLQQVRDTVVEIRRRKAMVADPAEPNSRSCGSFFVNPVVTQDEYGGIVDRGRAAGKIGAQDDLPHYDAGPGLVKLSAAWLIEHSGLQRGMRHGKAGLSERHVLAIVNFGGASAREILELKDMVRAGVQQAFGVSLEPEPVIVTEPG